MIISIARTTCSIRGLPHQKRWGRVTVVTLMLIALMGGSWLYSHQQQKEETKDKWERCRVAEMNNIKASAEEIVLREVIFV